MVRSWRQVIIGSKAAAAQRVEKVAASWRTGEEDMRFAIVQVAICLSLAPAVLKGQLFLIAGTPQVNEFNAAYASDLLQVGPDGVKVVASLLPANLLTGNVHISYDWRKVVIVAALANDYAVVLDFDEAKVTKACKLPKESEFGLVGQWLADVPGRGRV